MLAVVGIRVLEHERAVVNADATHCVDDWRDAVALAEATESRAEAYFARKDGRSLHEGIGQARGR